jgi:hypothetical protein
MEEIKPIQPSKIEVKKEIQEEKPKSLVEQMKELKQFKEQVQSGEIKSKKLRIPKRAKVKGRKLKKGYIGILKIDENRNISAEKQKISGSAYRDKDGIYHATDGREILFWMGKFPVIIQGSWKTNPFKFNPESENNETYGDTYKMAKMLKDTIKVKSKAGGSIIIWILLAGAALFGINYLMGGKIF